MSFSFIHYIVIQSGKKNMARKRQSVRFPDVFLTIFILRISLVTIISKRAGCVLVTFKEFIFVFGSIVDILCETRPKIIMFSRKR